MKKGDWKAEFLRDLIGIGSVPFFALVVVRIWIANNNFYLGQLLISGVLFLLLSYLFKSSIYSGLSLIALIFTGSYYLDKRYWAFGILVYFGLIYALDYLGKEKKKIFFGCLFGAGSAAFGNWLSGILFN
ncbi:hypothetical protein HN832_01420 [archaeon]|jgi:hypothetical protein|nr:hypothetical protein [archaeon]MBT4373957.1 hypothetical protein [archaeon]MBT4532350.1 hypothetical protein [archaeon]MBT7001936.1 hypothetical protein [archaeon]MBT7282051.1 hypothetical protein [archaeon]